MPERPFRLADAREICLAPFLLEAERRDAVRQAAARAEARRGAGVAWSGLGGEPTRTPRTAAELRAEAEAALARARAFAESPRGRYLQALGALEQLGYAGQADSARAAFSRGFADPGRPACAAEIGAALAALARIARPEARTACLALAELLGESLAMAAE